MRQEEFENFLKETLPDMGYVWRMLSRKNVRRKVQQRMESLGIHEWTRYRDLLLESREETAVFESLLRVTITRFFRNRDVWKQLGAVLVHQSESLRSGEVFSAWSAGCAGGEEPYSLAMLLDQLSRERLFVHPWSVLGTDSHRPSLKRAGELVYQWGSVREVPGDLLEKWFEKRENLWVLNSKIQENVTIRSHDTLRGPPPGTFHLVLTRNSVFTYNTQDVRKHFAESVRENIAPPGLLVVGSKETVSEKWGFEQVGRCIYKAVQST